MDNRDSKVRPERQVSKARLRHPGFPRSGTHMALGPFVSNWSQHFEFLGLSKEGSIAWDRLATVSGRASGEVDSDRVGKDCSRPVDGAERGGAEARSGSAEGVLQRQLHDAARAKKLSESCVLLLAAEQPDFHH